jgi:4'-phosphopantetheinyl transferase EntD
MATEADSAHRAAAISEGLVLLERLERRAPARLGILKTVAIDRTESLYAGEKVQIARAIQVRRNEFSSARWLARRALQILGFEPQPILTGAAREPIWPSGMTASITHSSSVCCVAFARAADFCGIGIDLETSRLPSSSLSTLIACRPGPREHESPELVRLVFSAKEAVYKAVYFTIREILGFQDVDIVLDTDSRSFSATTVHARARQAGLEVGSGIYELGEHGAATLFTIQPKSS